MTTEIDIGLPLNAGAPVRCSFLDRDRCRRRLRPVRSGQCGGSPRRRHSRGKLRPLEEIGVATDHAGCGGADAEDRPKPDSPLRAFQDHAGRRLNHNAHPVGQEEGHQARGPAPPRPSREGHDTAQIDNPCQLQRYPQQKARNARAGE